MGRLITIRDAIVARIPPGIIATIIIILWCLDQIGRLESAKNIPEYARPVLLMLRPYQWQLQLVLITLLIVVYLRHEHKLQNLIKKMRGELLAVQERGSALADALLDQDRVTYIAKERPALERAITQYFDTWLAFDRAGRNPKDWEAQDGYSNFHHAHAEMGTRLWVIKDISSRAFKIEWPERVDANTNAPPDLTGIPETLRKKYRDTYLEHQFQAATIQVVLTEIETKSQTAIGRIRGRLSRGAPWSGRDSHPQEDRAFARRTRKPG